MIAFDSEGKRNTINCCLSQWSSDVKALVQSYRLCRDSLFVCELECGTLRYLSLQASLLLCSKVRSLGLGSLSLGLTAAMLRKLHTHTKKKKTPSLVKVLVVGKPHSFTIPRATTEFHTVSLRAYPSIPLLPYLLLPCSTLHKKQRCRATHNNKKA